MTKEFVIIPVFKLKYCLCASDVFSSSWALGQKGLCCRTQNSVAFEMTNKVNVLIQGEIQTNLKPAVQHEILSFIK